VIGLNERPALVEDGAHDEPQGEHVAHNATDGRSLHLRSCGHNTNTAAVFHDTNTLSVAHLQPSPHAIISSSPSSQEPATDPSPKLHNSVNTLVSHFCNSHFNIIILTVQVVYELPSFGFSSLLYTLVVLLCATCLAYPLFFRQIPEEVLD
jgi:hypothetical protein